jgi:putative tryptophan/tyrosine transport system substrate-binding protein
MTVTIGRRKFVAALGSAAVAWPLTARAQQLKMPVVGLLSGVSFEGPYAAPVAAIRQGLQESGFVEGRNLAIEYRTADGQYGRLPELVADLVGRQVTVIVAIGGSTPELVTAAASPIPIVLAMGSDAVELSVISHLDRPPANATDTNATSRRLELMLEFRRAPLVAYLDNSRLPGAFETNVENVTAAARIHGRELVVFDAGTEREVEAAFTKMALQRVRALLVSPDPFLTSRQEQIIEQAAQMALPTIYATRGAVVAGGLMSYGVLTEDMYRIAGIYAGQILKGTTPAGLPVALPTRFQLVINRRTAEALRINVPPRLLIRADEIID